MMKKRRLLRVVSLIVPLLLISIWSFGQPITVRGKVKEKAGNPIPGATVVVKGTAQGTVTDQDGNYTLNNVNSNALLDYSFVGMKTVEIAVNGRTTIDIELEADVSEVEEVVVVGYGTQRKEAVTGSVASVKGDIVREVPSANISQSLQGREWLSKTTVALCS